MILTRKKKKRLALFNQGVEAVHRIAPEAPRGYVCPNCLKLFQCRDSSDRFLSLDHVPPRRLGGRLEILTCTQCNSRAGHLLEAKMKAMEDVLDFFRGTMEESRTVRFVVGRYSLKAEVRSENSVIRVHGLPRNNKPSDQQAVIDEFNRLADSGGHPTDSRLRIVFLGGGLSFKQVQIGWLRAGYLAVFAVLGYGYVLQPPLALVRKQLDEPTNMIIPKFYAHCGRANRNERRIVIVNEPAEFRSIAVQMGRHIVFLPAPGDSTFYNRLATESSRNVQFEGRELEWPKQPNFRVDFASPMP